MKILSWNIAGANGLNAEALAGVVQAIHQAKPDVVLLQEVAIGQLSEELAAALSEGDLVHFHHPGTPESPRKRYGCAVASRWPLDPWPASWAPGAPFPQLLAGATIQRPDGAFDAVSAHAPNGSRNGWRKIDTIEALLAGVSDRSRPLVVGGDFNEPVGWLPGERPESAARRRAKTGDPYGGSWTRADKGAGVEDTHPRSRWQQAVEELLLGTEFGLRHGFRSLHDEVPVTHVTSSGRERFFDHLLVSSDLEIVAAGYRHAWREDGISDHSASWVTVR